jgi:hypothetical protein
MPTLKHLEDYSSSHASYSSGIGSRIHRMRSISGERCNLQCGGVYARIP